MSRGVKLDRADWSIVQYAAGAPTASTKGNIYINSTNGTLYARRNEEASWSAISGSGASDHGALLGLSDDDHSQYPLLVGRAGGQTLRGGTASGDDLTLVSTSNATKGYVFLGAQTNAYFEDVGKLNITIPNTGNSSCAEFQQDDTTNGGPALIVGNDYSTMSAWENTDGWAIMLNGNNIAGDIIGSEGDIYIFGNTATLKAWSNSGSAEAMVECDSGTSTSDLYVYSAGAGDTTIQIQSTSDGGSSDITIKSKDGGSATSRDIVIGSDTGTDTTKERVRIYSGGGKYAGAADQVNQWVSYTPLLLNASELRLTDDGNSGSSWTQTYVLLSDGSNGEWNNFETNFGEVSIFNALNQLSGAVGGALALNDLSDVSTGGATQDQVIAYNSSSGTWSPATISGGAGALDDLTDVSTVGATDGQVITYNSSTGIWSPDTISGGGVTLDGAYDYGGAGSGKSITADTGAVTITVPDSSDNAALAIIQNNTSDNPSCISIANNAAGYGLYITHDDSSATGIFLTSSTGTSQDIYSDQQLTVGTTSQRSAIDGSFGGLILECMPVSGDSYIEINSESADNDAMIFIEADAASASDNGIISIKALGAAASSTTYVEIEADNNAGAADAYVQLDVDGSGTNSIRIGTTYGNVNEIRFFDVGCDSASWTQKYVLLTDGGGTQWTNYKSNFGEVSIFSALNQLAGAAGGALALDDLTDVSTGGATQDQVIAYNASSGTWSPATIDTSGGGWTTSENTDVDTGTENVDTFDPDGDGSVIWYYSVQNGVNHRAGIVMACWDDSAGTASYSDLSTSDIGDTSAVTLVVDMTGGSGTVRLKATATTDNWIVKAARAEIL